MEQIEVSKIASIINEADRCVVRCLECLTKDLTNLLVTKGIGGGVEDRLLWRSTQLKRLGRQTLGSFSFLSHVAISLARSVTHIGILSKS